MDIVLPCQRRKSKRRTSTYWYGRWAGLSCTSAACSHWGRQRHTTHLATCWDGRCPRLSRFLWRKETTMVNTIYYYYLIVCSRQIQVSVVARACWDLESGMSSNHMLLLAIQSITKIHASLQHWTQLSVQASTRLPLGLPPRAGPSTGGMTCCRRGSRKENEIVIQLRWKSSNCNTLFQQRPVAILFICPPLLLILGTDASLHYITWRIAS